METCIAVSGTPQPCIAVSGTPQPCISVSGTPLVDTMVCNSFFEVISIDGNTDTSSFIYNSEAYGGYNTDGYGILCLPANVEIIFQILSYDPDFTYETPLGIADSEGKFSHIYDFDLATIYMGITIVGRDSEGAVKCWTNRLFEPLYDSVFVFIEDGVEKTVTTSASSLALLFTMKTSITEFTYIYLAPHVTNLDRTWSNCISLTSFPLIDTSSVTNLQWAWYDCSSLTSFPLIDTSNVTNIDGTWSFCSSLTSFPLIDTSNITDLQWAWNSCSSLTSFPLIDTSSVTNMNKTWGECSSLTSFPLIDTSNVTDLQWAWSKCTSLTSFPLIDTSSVTSFEVTWYGCSSLTSFPAIDTSSVTNLYATWCNCYSLTSFPPIDTSSVTDFYATWGNVNKLPLGYCTTCVDNEQYCYYIDTAGGKMPDNRGVYRLC